MFLRAGRLIAVTLVIGVLAAACASDDDETAEPAESIVTTTTTSPPETTSAPTTTSAPETTTTTTTTTAAPEEPEPAAPVDFYFTETTTGQDMLSFGTPEEAECIREALGDTVFNVLVVTPVLALTASGGGAATAVPVFECLAPRTGAIIATALMDARVGGWEPETRFCIADLAEENPPLVLVGLGMATVAEIGTTISTWQNFGTDVYNCLSVTEKVALLAAIQSAVDAFTVMERDIVPNLLDSEIECIRSILGDDGYAELLAAPSANYAFATGEEWPDCVSEQTYREIFVYLNELAFLGLPDDTRSCMETFAVENPEYVSLLRVGDAQRAAMSDAELAAIAESGFRIYDCLDEPLRSQAQGFLAASLLPAPPVVVRPSELPADFVLTETTSGQEVVSLLTENEVACVRSGLDEAVFAALTAAPVMTVLEAAGEGASTTVSIFVCLEENSLALIGAAFMDAAAGGWSAETRMCVADLIEARPELVVEWLGADDSDPDFTPESSGC